ncbi:hypothetical protein J437_LFUL014072 [Ladona fulva]|uniref:Uncharacterized protein n=1 Tax=Ladona fulva TaxID=123851 RepID=A0A8K0KK95_LADFU|nr:hypothetical protein J437_LFUL014072 [Ladona fulva]
MFSNQFCLPCSGILSHYIVENKAPSGFDHPHKLLETINRICISYGKCTNTLHKWGMLMSPSCNCGTDKQSTIFSKIVIIVLHAKKVYLNRGVKTPSYWSMMRLLSSERMGNWRFKKLKECWRLDLADLAGKF